MRHTAGPGCIVRCWSSLPGITQADQEAEPWGQATLVHQVWLLLPCGVQISRSAPRSPTQDSVGTLLSLHWAHGVTQIVLAPRLPLYWRLLHTRHWASVARWLLTHTVAMRGAAVSSGSQG